MKTIIHKAETRGNANHGWLNSNHTFSFANYYNPERMHFGVLRVLNDDVVSPGKGFGKHSHDNMEIISIPLEGDLEHKDSTNGVYAFVLHGEVEINGQKLGKKDGFGIWEVDELKLKSISNAKVLLMEVPMQV